MVRMPCAVLVVAVNFEGFPTLQVVISNIITFGKKNNVVC